MSLRKHTRVGAAAFCALALVAAGCSKKSTTGPKGPTLAKGGTLKLAGLKDLTHLDTNQAYEVRAWGFVLRAATRQMLSYENTLDAARRDLPVPDLADGDAKISADGLTYTFKIKKGVKYNSGTEIVAGDFIRAIKRLCDPNGVSGGLSYFEDTITGMTDFCTGFSKIHKESIPAVKAYIDGHDVAGMKADGDKTLVVTLKQKAGDFTSMMTTPFTTPVPASVLDYLTDSAAFRQHFPASGPYQISTYVAKQKIGLTRNPNWDGKTDSIRHAYVNEITFQTNAASREIIQQQIETNKLDMYFRGNPPNTAQDKAEKNKDTRMHIDKDGACNFYISFNLHHTTPGGKLLLNKVVRQAINFAINKRAILQVIGGPRQGEPSGQILTPVLLGYKKIDPYATPSSKGDLTKAKDMLKAVPGAASFKLDYIYDSGNDQQQKIEQVVADQLKKIGITVNPVVKDDSTIDTTNPKADNWDLYYAGWCPDWNGNGARTFFTPLLSDPDLKNYNAGGSYNYGGYDSPAVDTKVKEALAADPNTAKDIWPDIDAAVMDDAPWVPVYTSNSVNFIGTRVKGFVFFPFSTSGDITNISVM